jgi:hypothetical protein
MTNLPQDNKLYAKVQTVYPAITLISDNSLAFTTYGPPNNIFFVAKSITDTSAIVQFKKPIYTNPSSYNISLTNITNSNKSIISNVSSGVIITNLSSNSAYEMKLQSVYSNSLLIANSYVIGFNTEGSVSDINYSNATDNSIVLSFNNYASTPNSYNLNIKDTSIQKVIQNIANQYTIQELSINTIYKSTIESIYDNSWSIILVVSEK